MGIKCLRTDKGGEFTSGEFNEYCRQHGIRRQLTAAYTPQQNGVAERKNRIMMNMVRCMLADKKIPRIFWAKAVTWTCYVLNRCPTSAVLNITPQEAWSGMKPTVEHFRIFGCLAHVHIPCARRGKLDNRSTVCVLLGISEETKGYRLYDPMAKRIVISRDVVFEEDKGWEWGESSQGETTVELEWGDNEEHDGNEGEREETSTADANGRDENSENEVTDGKNGGRNINRERGETSNAGGSNENTENEVINVDAITQTSIVDAEEEDVAEGYTENGDEHGNVGANNRRVSCTPTWMMDYVNGEGLSEDEAYIVLSVEDQQSLMKL